MFSKLEKDDKSYSIITSYLEFFCSNELNKTLIQFENQLQKDEIKCHLCLNGFKDNNEKEKIKWIMDNGKNYRNYLNACKFIACIIKVTKCDNLNKEYVYNLIDIYDNFIQNFIDTTY